MRLTKIVTKTGDQGTTGLADGTRLAKNDIQIEALGSIDELNSLLGMLIAENNQTAISNILLTVQHRLFDMGAELAMPGLTKITEPFIAEIEALINGYNSQLPALKEFILPGGSKAAALCHYARTVCRRCERTLVSVQEKCSINPYSLIYLNRLSDLLFILARTLNHQDHHPEILWQNIR